MASTRSILFLTNNELGQCNVAFAVAEEFLRRGEFTVHIGSYSPLAGLVEDLNKRVDCGRSVEFHEILGPSMTDLAVRSNVGLLFHRPGVKGATQGFQKVATAIRNWRPSEYHIAYQSCLAMIDKVRPDIVVVDPILHVGLDACRTAKARVVVLWPVPLKDVVITIQPKAGIFWKYPVTGSGYPFPLPWKLLLNNIYLVFRVVMALAMGKQEPDEPQDGKKVEGRSPFPLASAYSKDSLSLTPAFKELDFPLQVPDNVASCGPILRQCPPLSTSDPELDAWLTEPTVLINLGSHVRPSESTAVQMATGIRTVITERPDIKVLWKLKYDWESSEQFQKVLGPLITNGSVKVVSWIQADIMSVLQTGRIATYVHHGGANSYFEACKVGAPQVVLPQWLDTYDCATRVEWLGIGLNGSRTAAPGVEAGEFSRALLQVLSDAGIRAKSAAVKDLCGGSEGRVQAHDRIVQFCLN
ncbi:uncharacterized protein N7482_009869 [Penicillium canariense]|uniref:Erythromycin biosynthesis protein CIII-like C-terminal domain-containing protein n=1 Tax=Penicillium canariense TaxID=189055 RepID=A0A9W9HS54_9EURO|nr:uncharacterized protein N7482_009869 [Penicillium canariense]KAJ5153391.1 hypothetical protein N7482_009869 [Penicillium canariense]